MKGFPCLVLAFFIFTSQAQEDGTLRTERVRSKSRRFNTRGMPFGGSSMGNGGFGSGGSPRSPFHVGGGMGGMMNGGPFGGGPMGMGSSNGGSFSGPMRGPNAPGNPAMGGPSSVGNGMFNPAGFQCLRHRIMCPEWCRVVDENGCQSCPCGPGGGMIDDGDMSGIMSAFGAISPFHNSLSSGQSQKECAATKLCISMCAGSYSLGSKGPDGCQSCTCENKNPSSGGSPGYTGGFSSSSSSGSYGGGSGSGHGSNAGGSSGTGSYTTTLTGGSNTLLKPATSTGHQHQQVLVVTQQQVVSEVVCSASLSCSSTCSVGYTCGSDGCPTCECIHPSVVGIATQQVTIERPLYCAFSCQTHCETGYQCGQDGCPTCQCLQPVQQIIQVEPAPEVAHHETIMVTGNTGTECHECAPQPEPIYITEPSTECQYNCDELPHYVIERPQYQAVAVQQPEVCHNCETGQSQQYVPLPQYVHHRPETQQIITQTHEVCHECETTNYQPTYVAKPQQQTVIVQQPEVCHECETTSYQQVYVSKPQTETKPTYLQRPIYTETVDARPKPVYVTQSRPQTVANTGHSSGGIMLGVLTSGSSAGGVGGGIHTSIASHAHNGGGYYTGGSGGGWTGGSSLSCPPMPPDCNPSCIKYDVPHCRRCLCESSVASYGGSRYHG